MSVSRRWGPFDKTGGPIMKTVTWVFLACAFPLAAADERLVGSASPAGIANSSPAAPAIADAVTGEPAGHTAEISTAELRRILEAGSATVFDARPHLEFALSHIPGAINVSAKPGVPMSAYVSDVVEIGRVMRDRHDAPIVLYCNGPFCGKSKRLAEELLAAGYTNVRRYQLGIPVWRALGGVTVIEADGLEHVLAHDPTAVCLDTRDSAAFRGGSLPQAQWLPRSRVLEGKDVGEVKRAKDDGRLPMNDHNTRVIVISDDPADARFVAQALAREAFHNVSYFAGGMDLAIGVAHRGH